MPAGLTLRESMVLGTAGFTAALALVRMELLGQRPELGPIAVTGATGGVGSIAVSMLAARGYAVTAVSGRPEHAAYLRGLGAGLVQTPDALALGSRPLETARFGGVIDNVGGALLAGLVRHVSPWGSVACIGMAASPELSGTVFPLILRGVSLLGVTSTNCPMPLRTEVWTRLGSELKPPGLDNIVLAGAAPRRGDRRGLAAHRAAGARPGPGELRRGYGHADAVVGAGHRASTAHTGSWSLASVASSATPAAGEPAGHRPRARM